MKTLLSFPAITVLYLFVAFLANALRTSDFSFKLNNAKKHIIIIYINKMIRYLQIVIMLLVFCFSIQKLNASHLAGGDITYKCFGSNQYIINLKLYRDCGGVGFGTHIVIDIDGCGFDLFDTLSLDSFSEISALCISQQNSSNCQNGSLPGFESYLFSDTVTLPAQCEDWNISYSQCCRNGSITNLHNNQSYNFYLEAVINNDSGICNSSPEFTQEPVWYYWPNQPIEYNLGAIDSEGDSLSYALIPVLDSTGQSVTYDSGYSYLYPMSASDSLKIDSQTGQLSGVPDNIQTSGIAVQVNEYLNGELIGSTMRDIEFIVTGFSANYVPEITGINGSGEFELNACSGENICFDIPTSDSDAIDSLILNWNNAIPGAVFNTSTSSRPVGEFCWTPGLNDTGTHYFVASVKDNSCHNTSTSIYAFTIHVKGVFFDVVDTFQTETCPGVEDGSITIDVSGGSTPYQYSWSHNAQLDSSYAGDLSAGKYSVTVSDATGCEIENDFELQANFRAIIDSSQEASCFDNPDGYIAISTVGGMPPY
ncbi:MAG: SprB repeat-containing protein, partial [Chitinophagales bacterium]